MALKLKIIFGLFLVLLLSLSQVLAEEVEPQNSAESESDENMESITTKDQTVPSSPEHRTLGMCGQIKKIESGSDDDEIHNRSTEFGEFPWTAAIIDKAGNFICGGVLITTNGVLTTANCIQSFVRKTNSLIVKVGEWNTLKPNNEQPPQKRQVRSIIILDHYSKDFHMNNIALIVLENLFEFKDYIQPICLPRITENFEQRQCILTFWDVNDTDMVLKNVDALIISDTQCEKKLKELDIFRDLPLHESIICATEIEKGSACENLKGSLLICPVEGVENRFSLAGIASVGYDCPQEKFIGLFLNVALFRRWIDQNINATGLDELHYVL